MSYRMLPEREVSLRRIRNRLETDSESTVLCRDELVEIHEGLTGRRPGERRPVRYLRKQVLEAAVDAVGADIGIGSSYRRGFRQQELHIIQEALAQQQGGGE